MDRAVKKDYAFLRNKTLIPSAVAILCVSLLVGYSYYWNIDNIYQEKLRLALAQAKANWNKDAAFRRWATSHGGVYVRPDADTPPNPALAHLPDRDLVTTDGTRLTLMNPAYMMRQMTEQYEQLYGVKGKITGKLQLNPINKPDPWQLKALNLFESGATDEIAEQQMIDGKPYLRYMKAMYMTKGCVKCHGILGFKDGDLRGGVSVSIPLTPYLAAARETGKAITITHLVVWVLGVTAILLVARLVNKLLMRMAHEAMHDGLTGLPNITLFKNRLEQAFGKFRRNPDYRFAVCFLDLDRFKNLNDSRGHSVGDRLLVALSRRIEKLLRPGDTLARMGGDEFTLLLDDINGLDEGVRVAERILASFDHAFDIDGDAIYANASMGICMSTANYSNGDEMIRDADIAMYRAKASGKGRVDIFNPEMHDYAIETMQIENDLRSAIGKGQLEIHYQPVIDLERKRIDGFEALLRWHHPKLGLVSPERFIPVAENTGQIKTLGQWVLENACRQVREWSLQFSPEDEFTIAVNLSGVELTGDGMEKRVDEVLRRCNATPSKLHLEVTETVLVGQAERANKAISRLHKTGVCVSIDDFGTGYCSLTYLQTFDFDTLKIDKDFIQDMGPRGKGLQLVRTLMLLARDLKMRVVAEGVENTDQLNRLSAMKCPFIQGYYYARPLPSTTIKHLLEAGCHQDIERLRSMTLEASTQGLGQEKPTHDQSAR